MQINRNKVAIIGYGWVGKAMHRLFPDAYIYDIDRGSRTETNSCDVAFVCVPTPCLNEGVLDTTIIDEVMEWCACPMIVIRSTVNPGTCEEIQQKTSSCVVYQPEYLGETVQHPLIDMCTRPFIIMGGSSLGCRKLIELYTSVYNANVTIRQLDFYTAEVVKLSENRAIACKVAQCQELYDACERAGVDYYAIREAVYGDDPRFNLWFTFIYPEKRGMNSKCIPKDIWAWVAWAESVGSSASVTRAILDRNKQWIASGHITIDSEMG
jgi:UDPglucose 6-dehydrogenase